MKRAQLDHIIHAACTIADDDELVIIGSQSILAQFLGLADDKRAWIAACIAADAAG